MLELLHDYQRQLQFIPRALLLGVIMLFMYMFIKDNWNIKECFSIIKGRRWQLFFFSYFGFVLIITIFSRDTINPFMNIFADFGLFKNNKFNLELIENITLFIPYTVLYIQAFKPVNIWKAVIIITVLTTVFIELFQMIFWVGEFQFSDMIHNVIGGIIGCSIWIFVRFIKEKIQKT